MKHSVIVGCDKRNSQGTDGLTKSKQNQSQINRPATQSKAHGSLSREDVEKERIFILEGAAASDRASNPVFQSVATASDVTDELACSPRRTNTSMPTKTTSVHRADDGQKRLDQSLFSFFSMTFALIVTNDRFH